MPRRLALGASVALSVAVGAGCSGSALDAPSSALGLELDSRGPTARQALLTDEEAVPLALESMHPVENGKKQELLLEAPRLTRELRVHFARIDLERDRDFVSIQDEWGNEIERVTGRHRGYVSKTVYGGKARVVVEASHHHASWGVSIDELLVKRCVPKDPAAAELRPLSTCEELEQRVRALATKLVKQRFADGGGMMPLANAKAGGDAAAAPAHSETNVQVEGVDEADIVKTNGRFIYQLSGSELRVFQAFPADQTKLAAQVALEGSPRGLFLDGDRLIVLQGVQGDDDGSPTFPIGIMSKRMGWWRPDAFTKVTTYDVSAAVPVVQSELLVAGQFSDARRVGDSVRLVQRRELSFPAIQYWPNDVDYGTQAYADAMRALESDALAKVAARPLADWLPKSYRLVPTATGVERVAIEPVCSDFLLPADTDDTGLTSVVTLQLADTAAATRVQDTSLMVQAGVIYQSADNLYLTAYADSGCYELDGLEGQSTRIHKLDVTAPDATRYVATGVVPGTIDDQFQLDEHEGYLRVATTTFKWALPTPAEQSSSRLYVLGQAHGSRLEIVGQTPELAPGERMFASRMLGDRGFVVTFRQVDPLFTLDLSDPRAPHVVGELKIPGFSTYLHVLDDTHLFSVGQDFEVDGTTRNGTALSIYDVADLAHPRLTHKSVVGSTHGYSDALYDHKAFTLYRPAGEREAILAIPFTDWDDAVEGDAWWSSFKSSVKVFRVSAGGVLEVGEVDHTPFYAAKQSHEWSWWYAPNVQRGLFIEQSLYTVSDAGLRVAALADPSSSTADVPVTSLPVLEERVLWGDASPDVAIPDHDDQGVEATVELPMLEDGKPLVVENLHVDVEIRHSRRGDLVVTLEHKGVVATLLAREGEREDDVIATFPSDAFDGLDGDGAWTLRVVDASRRGEGRLVRFGVTVSGKHLTQR
jgi:hypothetical protein